MVERAKDSDRFVDLALSLCVCDVDTSGPVPVEMHETDEELVEIGRWDR